MDNINKKSEKSLNEIFKEDVSNYASASENDQIEDNKNNNVLDLLEFEKLFIDEEDSFNNALVDNQVEKQDSNEDIQNYYFNKNLLSSKESGIFNNNIKDQERELKIDFNIDYYNEEKRKYLNSNKDIFVNNEDINLKFPDQACTSSKFNITNHNNISYKCNKKYTSYKNNNALKSCFNNKNLDSTKIESDNIVNNLNLDYNNIQNNSTNNLDNYDIKYNKEHTNLNLNSKFSSKLKSKFENSQENNLAISKVHEKLSHDDLYSNYLARKSYIQLTQSCNSAVNLSSNLSSYNNNNDYILNNNNNNLSNNIAINHYNFPLSNNIYNPNNINSQINPYIFKNNYIKNSLGYVMLDSSLTNYNYNTNNNCQIPSNHIILNSYPYNNNYLNNNLSNYNICNNSNIINTGFNYNIVNNELNNNIDKQNLLFNKNVYFNNFSNYQSYLKYSEYLNAKNKFALNNNVFNLNAQSENNTKLSDNNKQLFNFNNKNLFKNPSSENKINNELDDNISYLKEIDNKYILVKFLNNEDCCKQVQRKLQKMSSNVAEYLVSLLLSYDYIPQIMMNNFANYLLQKALTLISSSSRCKVLKSIVKTSSLIGINIAGTHCIQLLSSIISTEEEIDIYLTILNNNIQNYSFNGNGVHIIMKALENIIEEKRNSLNINLIQIFSSLLINPHGVCIVRNIKTII